MRSRGFDATLAPPVAILFRAVGGKESVYTYDRASSRLSCHQGFKACGRDFVGIAGSFRDCRRGLSLRGEDEFCARDDFSGAIRAVIGVYWRRSLGRLI